MILNRSIWALLPLSIVAAGKLGSPAPRRNLLDLTDVPNQVRGECEGPCSHDSHCSTGLICHHREKDSVDSVPGCTGEGKPGGDYCIKPPSDNVLLKVGDNGVPAGAFPLTACRGDCDSDAECAFGLVCFDRIDNGPVPGCTGAGTNIDYCTVPVEENTLVFKKLPGDSSTNLGIFAEKVDNSIKLGICEGHCESHVDCEDGLMCFDRKDREEVPGCNGKGDKRANYCFQPRDKEIIYDPNPEGQQPECHGHCKSDSDCEYGLQCQFRKELESVEGCVGTGRIGSNICFKNTAANALVLMGFNQLPAENYPLGPCQGHCSSTGDCEFGLVCFERGKNATVPGCVSKGRDFRDYCTQPQYPNELVFAPTGDRLDGDSNGLQACQGECTSHDQCGEGLKCFFRSNDEAIPGCIGRAERKVGYCFEATPGESLVFNGFLKSTASHSLGLCEGSCRVDSDCHRGLICHKRNGFESVPGCTGTGFNKANYCVSPSSNDTLIVMGKNNDPPDNFPLDECSGHCSTDLECQFGLSCFDRKRSNPVPNCSGPGQTNTDYCIRRQSDAMLVLGRHDEREDSRDVSVVKLGMCEGDCRSHLDCEEGLYCFKRSSKQQIPGCDAGGQKGANYCYDPKQAACTDSGLLEFTASICTWETFQAELNFHLDSIDCEHDALQELKLLMGTHSSNEVRNKFELLCENQIELIDRTGFKDFDAIATEERNTVFTKAFYNGGTDWNDLKKTNEPGITETYTKAAQHGGISWPGEKEIMRNFQKCNLDTVMCCWTEDVTNNSNACYVDMNNSPTGPHTKGFAVYNENEGNMNCHGFAWEIGSTMSEIYKGNSLFYVSMYDHLSQRGYVDNLPGAHICGCIEQMPVVTRADCTQMHIKQKAMFKVGYNIASVTISDDVHIKYEECEGAGGENNDLLAHYEKLTSEGKQSKARLDVVRKKLVGEGNCKAATEKWLLEKKKWRALSSSLETKMSC